MATNCTLTSFALNGGKLPIQFSYKPPSPKTRFSIQKTGDGGVTVQGNNPTAGDAVVEWTCPDCTRAEWKAFLDLYTAAANVTTQLTFTGYWGENFKVLALDSDTPPVRGGRFDLSGRLHVIEVTSWGTAS